MLKWRLRIFLNITRKYRRLDLLSTVLKAKLGGASVSLSRVHIHCRWTSSSLFPLRHCRERHSGVRSCGTKQERDFGNSISCLAVQCGGPRRTSLLSGNFIRTGRGSESWPLRTELLPKKEDEEALPGGTSDGLFGFSCGLQFGGRASVALRCIPLSGTRLSPPCLRRVFTRYFSATIGDAAPVISFF